MSAAQAMLSQQFIDVMGPMAGDARAVDQVFSYIRLMRATQHVEEVSLPSLSHEVESRLDKAEADFAEGKGISEAVARQHRHSFVNQLIAQ